MAVIKSKKLRVVRHLVLMMLVVLIGTPAVAQRQPAPVTIQGWVTKNPPRSEHFKNRVMIFEFWATWCPACVKVVPKMKELTAKYAPKGALFIAFSQDRDVRTVGRFVRDNQINYHVAMDNGVSRSFSFQGIPSVFIIDHYGRVAWAGYPFGPDFEAAINKAVLAAPPGFLEGLKLGPFEHSRLSLEGGPAFNRAYRQIKLKIRKGDPNEKLIAAEVIKTVEERIGAKVKQVEQLCGEDKLAAYKAYMTLAKDFKGSDAAKIADVAAEVIAAEPGMKAEVEAAEKMQRVEKILSRCKTCDRCISFDFACRDCRSNNPAVVERTTKILNEICTDSADTKAAETAKKLLNHAKKRQNPG